MKKIMLIFCVATTLLFSCINNEDSGSKPGNDQPATDKKEAEAPITMPDSATMMKNWQAYMTPGDVHKMMASWNGTWDGAITMWEKEGAAPQTSKGTCVNKMIMGGRYQVSNHTGNMMGMPFEGLGTLAYDNAKKMFISTWVDNMGTGIMKMEGTWDEATKSMTLKGKCVNACVGKEMDFWEKFTVVDDNTQMMEMHGPGPDGKEMKMMEIKFTRKK